MIGSGKYLRCSKCGTIFGEGCVRQLPGNALCISCSTATVLEAEPEAKPEAKPEIIRPVPDQTACVIKPEAYPAFAARILERIFHEGFGIRLAGTFTFTSEMLYEFYIEHVGKEFYPNLVKYMTAGPSFGMVLSRKDAIDGLRDMIGPATIADRKPWQLRTIYGDPKRVGKNAIHGSDTPEAAQREIELIFQYIWFHA